MTETMTRQERLDAAINLQEPDRVPISPMIMFFAARHAGITVEKFLFDPKAGFDAIVRTFEDLGGWDVQFVAGSYDPLLYAMESPIRLKLPGVDLPPDSIWQAHEAEIMSVEDYQKVIDLGWNPFYYKYLLPKVYPGYGGDFRGQVKLYSRLAKITVQTVRDNRYWKKREIPTLIGTAIGSPFEVLSMARSFAPFFSDIFKHPQLVKDTMDAMLPDMISSTIQLAKLMGIPRVQLGGTRGSGQFISPAHFEEFYLPYLIKMVEAFYDAGLVSLMHFDSDWTKNLSYFKELPRASAILELDSTTDIFQAKQVLGGHLCLMGDVPASLLTLGTPAEVRAYTRRLIDEVGEGGGFILSSGCEVPHDAKFENVKAMIDTGKEYQPGS